MRRKTEWTETLRKFYPKYGDLIEIDKIIYHHWAIYISDGEVIYFEPVNTAEMVLCLKFDELVPGVVKTELLEEAVGSYRFRINNKPKLDKNPRSHDDIVRLIDLCQSQPRELDYSLKYFNCEHFVTYIKFGVTHSNQMSTETQFLFTFALSTGTNYLKELGNVDNKWETTSDALKPIMNGLEESVFNQVFVKPPIEKEIEKKLERFFGRRFTCGFTW